MLLPRYVHTTIFFNTKLASVLGYMMISSSWVTYLPTNGMKVMSLLVHIPRQHPGKAHRLKGMMSIFKIIGPDTQCCAAGLGRIACWVDHGACI